MEYLIAPPVGIVVGILLGMLGGGGAILAVPALVYLLGQHPKSATFGSLLIVLVSAPAALIGHWRAGRVRLAAGVAFAAAGLAGSFLGSQVSIAANPNVLLIGFAALMLVVAVLMGWRLHRSRVAAVPAAPLRQAAMPAAAGAVRIPDAELSPAVPASSPGGGRMGPADAGADISARAEPDPAATGAQAVRRARQLALIVVTATAIGFLTGLFGVGGGIIVVPALVLALGFEMPIAVGTSLVVVILNSLAAVAARLGNHVTLNWAMIGVFMAGAIGGAVVGNKLASRVNTRRLSQAFVVLIVVVAAYITTSSALKLG